MNKTIIGLDAICMVLYGKCPKQIEQSVEKRTEQGRLYLQVEKTKRKDEYNVKIILPCLVRPNNIQGFGILDSVKLELVAETIKRDLQEILGMRDLSSLIVKKVECNANKEISTKANIKTVIALLSRALLKTDSQQKLYVRGESIAGTRTIKKIIVDGFEMERDSCARFNIKIYDKTEQMEIKNQNKILRVELIYNSRGISQALRIKGKIKLTDLLQKQSLQKIINRYVVDVKEAIMPQIKDFLEDAVNLILDDLKGGYSTYTTFLKRQDIIQYDYRIFRLALKKFYKMKGLTKQSAVVQASRIKARVLSEGLVIHERTVKELECNPAN